MTRKYYFKINANERKGVIQNNVVVQCKRNFMIENTSDEHLKTFQKSPRKSSGVFSRCTIQKRARRLFDA